MAARDEEKQEMSSKIRQELFKIAKNESKSFIEISVRSSDHHCHHQPQKILILTTTI